MNMKSPLLAAIVAGLPMASGAFTLDAVGYEGAGLSLSPSSIFVPGYGIVIFEATPGSALVIDSAYENDHGFRGPTLSFDQKDAVRITFGGQEPLNPGFDFVGLSLGEVFEVQEDFFTPQSFLVTLRGDEN
jgi:hypothetical protein